MKAWAIKAKPTNGGLGDLLELVGDMKTPEPAKDQILVKNEYCSVAIDDIRIAENRFMPMLKVDPSADSPFVPGHECGGTVVAVGPDAESETGKKFKVGDKVYGVTSARAPPGNAWAEYVLMPVGTTGQVPEEWDVKQAVASITGASVGIAVLKNLPEFDKPPDEEALAGKIIVIIGASSSIGSSVLQWLVQRKARVWAVCSGRKAQIVTKLGAEAILDYTKGPWEDQLPASANEEPEQVDYVLDFVGGTKQEIAAKKVLKNTSESKFITVVGPNDDTSVAIGWGGLIGMAGKIIWRMISWRKPSFAMAVQDDPHDNTTPALGTKIVPLIDQVVDGWNKQAVSDAIQLVNSRRAAGRVLLKFGV